MEGGYWITPLQLSANLWDWREISNSNRNIEGDPDAGE